MMPQSFPQTVDVPTPLSARHAPGLREPTAHRPGHRPARVQIQHDGQIHPPLLRPDIGEVSGPDPPDRFTVK